MTPEAKRALSGTIRALRTRLLGDLHAATEGAYRLSLKAKNAKLGEEARIRRERLESWISEQVRALPQKEQAGAGERFRLEVEKDAASTLLNRIVYLRLLEASGLREEKVATGGWESRGYKHFREFAPALVRGDGGRLSPEPQGQGREARRSRTHPARAARELDLRASARGPKEGAGQCQ